MAPHWDKENHPNGFAPKRMLATEYWNKVEHQKTSFDGKVKAALLAIIDDEKTSRNHRKTGLALDWLVVTVDFHN